MCIMWSGPCIHAEGQLSVTIRCDNPQIFWLGRAIGDDIVVESDVTNGCDQGQAGTVHINEYIRPGRYVISLLYYLL